MTNKQQASLSFINNCKLNNGIHFHAELNEDGGLWMELKYNNARYSTVYNGLDSETTIKREIRRRKRRKLSKADEGYMTRLVTTFINFYN